MQKELTEIKGMQDTVDQKAKKRDLLIGKQQANMDSLKKLGYETVDGCLDDVHKRETQLHLRKTTFRDDLDEFKVLYADLL